MKLSVIFEEKPERWGLRGDPYFWDFLKEHAETMDLLPPDEVGAWIKREFFALCGKELNEHMMARIDRFAHGGMSSGGVDGDWWCNDGIPLLQSRLEALWQKETK